MALITPERAGEIRGQLVEQHGGTWLHHYHEAIEAEVIAALREQGRLIESTTTEQQ